MSVANPLIWVGEPKYKVDGITKYIEDQDFLFDFAFSDYDKTD